MEQRYELREKIGEGGLGSVYRGYDTRMQRDVAIKRITSAQGNPTLQEESTRQLVKEASALASFQHPHVVTIYDVGSDEEGPYVVMEFINGKTLDAIIENAPLTWTDFRELALQTQEALIAAQELELIHGDIKPSNLMLTWLPSGKFQMKIVDFGLATLTHSQSQDELKALETVFGSIFFMAPEQFERIPLDARTDVYSMGCVYYQALAGVYPFNGKSNMGVMDAHLDHAVIPLQDIRADIPMWVCEWIMWQLNRMPKDRPASSRECLAIFYQNDTVINPRMSTGVPPVQKTLLQSKANMPPSVQMPRSATLAARLEPEHPYATNPAQDPNFVATENVASAAALKSQQNVKKIPPPQALVPPEGSKPSVHRATPPIQTVVTPISAGQTPHQTTSPVIVASTPAAKYSAINTRKTNTKNRKTNTTTFFWIAGVAAIILVYAFFQYGPSGNAAKTNLNEMLSVVSQKNAASLPINKDQLDILLKASSLDNNPAVFKALRIAGSTDGTDVSLSILNYITQSRDLSLDVKEKLLKDVLKARSNPSVNSPLMDYITKTSDPKLKAAAIEAMKLSVSDAQFTPLIDIIQNTPYDEVRIATEKTLDHFIRTSQDPTGYSSHLKAAYLSSTTPKIRRSMIRLLARCGGDTVDITMKSALKDNDSETREAAISALGVWDNDSGFSELMEILNTTTDARIRSLAFDTALGYVSDPDANRNSIITQELWTKLSTQAKSPEQQKKIIAGLEPYGNQSWALQMITEFSSDPKNNPLVIQFAKDALDKIHSTK